MPEHQRTVQNQRRPTSHLSSLVRWFQLKKYQYEVTFSLYMMTPTERFVFNLIVFVLISLLTTAASLYLPDHIAVIYNRIWYYVHGEFGNTSGNGSFPIPAVMNQEAIQSIASTINETTEKPILSALSTASTIAGSISTTVIEKVVETMQVMKDEL